MTEPLRLALRQQAAACATLGSPFMARLCTLLAEGLRPDTRLTRRLFDWPGDLRPSGDSLPLRLCGALHALVLRGDPALAAVYPPNQADDARLWSALQATLTRHAAFIDAFLDSAPQTNEVRRSAVLIAVAHTLAARFALPLVLSELGASAGLNLMWDRYALAPANRRDRLGPATPALILTPDWQGDFPAAQRVIVAERAAVDLNPIDLNDPEQRQRLLAYLWADQPHRRALTEAAIATAPPRPVRADAIDWLAGRLTARPGHLHLIWTTIAWQYFARDGQQRGRALIEAAGANASPEAPLAWLSYEADGQSPGAGLVLRLWPGDLHLDLGRADFHGRWVDWRAS